VHVAALALYGSVRHARSQLTTNGSRLGLPSYYDWEYG
jgi:hypothetical protein